MVHSEVSARLFILMSAFLAAGLCFAQFRPGRGSGLPGNLVRIEGGSVVNEDEVRTARETASHASGNANWTNTTGFGWDVFTFTRGEDGAFTRGTLTGGVPEAADLDNALLRLRPRSLCVVGASTDAHATILQAARANGVAEVDLRDSSGAIHQLATRS